MSFPTGWWKYGIRGVSRMISTHKLIPMGKWWSMDYHANLGVETAITPKDPKRVTPIGAIFIGQTWKEATPNFSHPARCWEASCGTSIRRSCSGVWSLCQRAPGRKAWEFISRKGDLTIISVVKLDMKLIWVVSNVRHPPTLNSAMNPTWDDQLRIPSDEESKNKQHQDQPQKYCWWGMKAGFSMKAGYSMSPQTNGMPWNVPFLRCKWDDLRGQVKFLAGAVWSRYHNREK